MCVVGGRVGRILSLDRRIVWLFDALVWVCGEERREGRGLLPTSQRTHAVSEASLPKMSQAWEGVPAFEPTCAVPVPCLLHVCALLHVKRPNA